MSMMSRLASSTPEAIAYRQSQALQAEREQERAAKRRQRKRYRPPAFYRRVANDMGWPKCDDVFIASIEAACVTEAEYKANHEECQQRIYAAVEELAPRDYY